MPNLTPECCCTVTAMSGDMLLGSPSNELIESAIALFNPAQKCVGVLPSQYLIPTEDHDMIGWFNDPLNNTMI